MSSKGWFRLSAAFVRTAHERGRGRHADGGNLFLEVAPGGSASWTFNYQRGGIRRSMGFGSVHAVSLALARELASKAREQLARGEDPTSCRS